MSLRGDVVYLRLLTRADLTERYAGWLNDPEVNRYLETRSATVPSLTTFFDSVASAPDNVVFAIVSVDTDEHIGNVKLGPIDLSSGIAVLGMLIGDKRYWGRGVCREATSLALRYAFDELGVQRVELGVHAEHKAAIRCYEAAGFTVEKIVPNDLVLDGEPSDRAVMAAMQRPS